jgi:hypothetical protein
VVLATHVDDCMATGTNQRLVDESKKGINEKYKMTDLGPCRWLLGIKIERELHNLLIPACLHQFNPGAIQF